MAGINRWKLADNLRRSLVAPASLGLLVLAAVIYASVVYGVVSFLLYFVVPKIVKVVTKRGSVLPLPTKIRKFTVNSSTFVHKDARDQYEMRIHRRLIDLAETTFKTIESLQSLSLPSGVDIDIKMG